MATVTVSVIVPVYNREALLADALTSILRQTRIPDQIIVVDDGSTDGSAAIARQFGDRVELVRQSNQGVGAARNQGLKQASGAIIAFLDSDDLWRPDAMAEQIAQLARNPEAGVAWGLSELGAIGDGEVAMGAWREGAKRLLQLGSMAFRRELFHTVGGFSPELRSGEDIDLVMRLNERGVAMIQHDAVIQLIRRHGANLTEDAIHSRRALLAVARRASQRRKMNSDKG
jgi:glycosyltransferase involved in cell wall biosynthesis